MEEIYLKIMSLGHRKAIGLVPYVRRFIRFLALPYCYFNMINWDECTASRLQVARDLLYIFFVLKYFPDNYSPCRLWEKARRDWILYYGSIYDPYQRSRLRKHVQRKAYEIVFQDKEICYKLCMASGLPLPRQFGLLEPTEDYREQIRSMLTENGVERIIVKPVTGKGGKGILLVNVDNQPGEAEDSRIFIRHGSETTSLNDFFLKDKSVVQEYVVQHPLLEEISSSVNTIRVVTLLAENGEVLIIGAYMKFGVGNSYVDNRNGRVAVGIHLESGIIKDSGFDFKSRKYLSHPTSGFIFKGFHVPYWGEVRSLAQTVQTEFSFYKLLGLDIAVTPEGPVVIEINGMHDNVGLEQNYGPILNDPDVRLAFKKYNLLINKAADL